MYLQIIVNVFFPLNLLRRFKGAGEASRRSRLMSSFISFWQLSLFLESCMISWGMQGPSPRWSPEQRHLQNQTSFDVWTDWVWYSFPYLGISSGRSEVSSAMWLPTLMPVTHLEVGFDSPWGKLGDFPWSLVKTHRIVERLWTVQNLDSVPGTKWCLLFKGNCICHCSVTSEKALSVFMSLKSVKQMHITCCWFVPLRLGRGPWLQETSNYWN